MFSDLTQRLAVPRAARAVLWAWQTVSRFSVPAIALAIPLVLVTACSQSGALSVSDPEIRDLVPGRDTTAAYFRITNNTSESVTLTGAQSEFARAIEMHTTAKTSSDNGDRVSMRRLDNVTIPAGESVDFSPGGHHLMVFGVSELTQPFPITLTFVSGKRIAVSFSKLAL